MFFHHEAYLCKCYQGQPGKDASLVTGENLQVPNIPSSSHLSVNTDDSNFLEPAEISAVRPDKYSQPDAR